MQTRREAHDFHFVTLILLVLFASGCAGDFSYKRGAGMGDFQQEKANCTDQNKTDYEIEQCLNKSGWVVVGTDKPLARMQTETTGKPEDVTLIVDKEAMVIIADPMQKVTISSWWKAGAGPDQLLAEGDSCALELGEKYKAEANMSIATNGLISCMKEKGWFALQEK